VGGLWNYSPLTDETLHDVAVPQTRPYPDLKGNSHGVRNRTRSSGVNGYTDPSLTSPVYDKLETNIPRSLMGFSNLDWPSTCQLFPPHEDVLDYIHDYADEVRHLIRFDRQVSHIRLLDGCQWLVQSRRLFNQGWSDVKEDRFDAVLVANGHFNVPYIPSVPGIEEWNNTFPGSIMHSKFYRNSHSYAGKKTIVVGNSASGTDIARQIATMCELPLLQSQRSESYLLPEASETIVPKPEIARFEPASRTVHFKDGSCEFGIDAVLYCTGYFYSYPFLRSLEPPLITTGERVENLYNHIFYRPNPTLAFVALNQKVIPFPIAEAQSAVVARVWSGRIALPSSADMAEWEAATLREAGNARSFHVLKFPQDANYINALHDWAMSADRLSSGKLAVAQRQRSKDQTYDPETDDGSAGDCCESGKMPPYWDEKAYWTRERFPAIKKAFQQSGEERHSRRTLESVGFDFERWKRGGA